MMVLVTSHSNKRHLHVDIQFYSTFFNICFWSACQILVAKAMCAHVCFVDIVLFVYTPDLVLLLWLLYIRFEITILTLFLLVIIVLAILSWFHMSFTIFLNSLKNIGRLLIGIVLIAFDIMNSFIMLTLLIYKHRVSFHFLVSFCLFL